MLIGVSLRTNIIFSLSYDLIEPKRCPNFGYAGPSDVTFVHQSISFKIAKNFKKVILISFLL